MAGMLAMVNEELPDVPFYYVHDRLCSLAKVSASKMSTFRSAILNGGYRVSLSHANRLAIKTDAPPEFIWDMLRAHQKQNPSNRKNWTDVARAILEPEKSFSDAQIDFTEHENAEPDSKKMNLLRFQHNPPNWGPKSKARVFAENSKTVDKRARNQGKHSKKRQKEGQNGSECKKEKIEPS